MGVMSVHRLEADFTSFVQEVEPRLRRALVGLRTRASRSLVGAPAVGPLDEFDREDAGDGEVDLSESR